MVFCMKQKLIIIIFLLIFALQIFTRFYQLFERADFGWDQVDNAWAAYDILIKHQVKLVGMEGKLNSGVNIGPLYYYFITPFYHLSGLDPIVSPIIAGITSIIGFFVLFFVTKKMFNTNVALIAVFINSVSISLINSERTQWPVNFIAMLSYIILYLLYKFLCGQPKYLIPLAVAVGLDFHIHFTAIFFPVIIILTLPFYPRNKETLKYLIFSIPIFLIFLVPNFIYNIQAKNASVSNFTNYFNTYYHGLHLRRVLQLSHDAFIKFESILFFRFFHPLVFIFYPLFSLFILWKNKKRENLLLVLLLGLWIVVPWIIFATYSGEISDYYFNSTVYISMVIIAYLTYKLFCINFLPIRIVVISFWLYFSVINIQQFLVPRKGNMSGTRTSAQNAINERREVKYGRGNAEAYMYNYLKLRKK